MTAKPPSTRDQNEASSAPLPPRLVHALAFARAATRSKTLLAVAALAGLTRWPSFADWLSGFPAFNPAPLGTLFVPPFTNNWRSFTAASPGVALAMLGLSLLTQGVLIALTHQFLFGRKLEPAAALRDGIRALPRLGWLLAMTLLGSPLLAMIAAVILLPIYLLDRLLGGSGAAALASTLGPQLASLLHLVGFELSPRNAQFWAPSAFVWGCAAFLLYPWLRLAVRGLIYDYSPERARTDQPGERVEVQRSVPVVYMGHNYQLALTSHYYAGRYSEKDRMVDRGLAALLDQRGLAFTIFAVSLGIDLLVGPLAGKVGVVTIGWLLPAQYVEQAGYMPYHGARALFGIVGLALGTYAVLWKTMLWTFLYHSRRVRDGE